jgi:hypothetical protein
MHTLTPDQLAELLRQWAAGSCGDEAAVELLIAHDTWLHRDDFVVACVDYDHDGTHPVAWVDWHAVVPWIDDGTRCSASEARVLRLAAELAGVDSGQALLDLFTSLDDRNSQLVLDAIAHVLTRGRRAEWLATLGGTLVRHDTTTWGRPR